MYQSLHTDQHLLEALAAGDRKVTAQIYRQQGSVLIKWIVQRGGTHMDADDVLQEAMVVLFEKAQDASFRLSAALGTYLFAVGRHLWLKKLQQNRKSPENQALHTGDDEGIDSAYEEDIQALAEKEGHYEQLSQALVLLGEPCSSLLKAFYLEQKSMQEIAQEFGYTNPDNAKTQKYKCLNRLRKLFYKQNK